MHGQGHFSLQIYSKRVIDRKRRHCFFVQYSELRLDVRNESHMYEMEILVVRTIFRITVRYEERFTYSKLKY
jgi:hypothetical protein